MTFELNWKFQLQGWSLCRFPDVLICQSLWNRNSQIWVSLKWIHLWMGAEHSRETSLGPLVELYIKGWNEILCEIMKSTTMAGIPFFPTTSRMEWESHPWNCIRLIFPHFMEMPRPTPIILSIYFLKFPGCISCVFFKPLASSVVHTTHFRQPDNVLLCNFCSIRLEPAKGFAARASSNGTSAKHASKEGVKPCVFFLHKNQFKPWDLMTCLPRSSLDKRKVRIGELQGIYPNCPVVILQSE